MEARAGVVTPARVGRLAGAAALLLAAAVIAAWSPWHTATFLAVTSVNGIESGDVAVLPLVAAACWLVLGDAADRDRYRAALRPLAVAGPVAFGAALVVVSVLRFGALGRTGRLVELALFLASGLWWLAATAPWPSTWLPERRHAAVAAVALYAAGTAVDMAFPPTGTMFGPTLLAGLLAAWAAHRWLAAAWWAAAGVLVALNVASIVDIAGVDVRFSAADGGRIRAVTLGAVLLAASCTAAARSGQDAIARQGGGRPQEERDGDVDR